MEKKVLVTGAGGFIGYQLCNYLTEIHHQVTGVDLQYPKDIVPPLFDAHRLDFRDSNRLRPLMERVEVVFHLAGAHLKINLDESDYWDVNVNSLPNLMKIAQTNGVQKFIHISSVGVYGNLTSWPANENSPSNPQSIYGGTKLAGEKAVQNYSEKTGFPFVIIRPAWVYGPTCPRTRKLYKSLRLNKFIMIGKGENLRHPIYIKDFLEACRLTLEKQSAIGELFIIAGENAITTWELISTICNVFGLKEPIIRFPYPVGKIVASGVEGVFRLLKTEPPISTRTLEFFDTNNAFDISKAKKTLGFNPRFSFKEGLIDCKDELEKHVNS